MWILATGRRLTAQDILRNRLCQRGFGTVVSVLPCTELFLLWNESGRWIAQAPYGPRGQGATEEAAVAELKQALLSKNRSQLRGASREFYLSTIERIEKVCLDDCLYLSLFAFEFLMDRHVPRSPRSYLWGMDGREPPLGTIYAYPHGSFFRRQRILSIGSARYDLEARSLPTGGSWGTFCFDGVHLLCLNRRIDNLQAIFKLEQRPIDEADPRELARLVAESVGRAGNGAHELITADKLEEMASDRYPLSGYRLKRRTLARISGKIIPASISETERGWILSFTTIRGFMHELQEVISWNVGFSKSFDLDVHRTRLCKRIFSRVPAVIY